MTVDTLENCFSLCPPSTRLLGLDVGKKTIGLALSDEGQSIATPLKTIERKKFSKDILELKKIIDDYQTGGFVIGYPINMDGSEGPRCESIRHFAQELENNPQIVGTNPWISLWDERLSTASVESFVGKFVDIKKAKQKGVIDKLAAQTILQGALDFMRVAKNRL